MTRIVWATLVVLVWAGCADADDAEPPPPPITYQESPQPGAVKAARLAQTEGELPIVADFDDESEREINADNFRRELDRLEAEITADSAN
jgi:hypothetical protein